jgi:hypothetical protein
MHTDKPGWDDLEERFISNIALLHSNRRIRGGNGTFQLGWGAKLAHCSTTTFAAVKQAHRLHLCALKNLTILRNPLSSPYLSAHTPPTTFYLENRNIQIGQRTSTGNSWTEQHGTQGFYFAHFSTRRSLVITDCHSEGDITADIQFNGLTSEPGTD